MNNSTHKPMILVTSATGRTGSVAVLELLQKGFPVRAFVRRKNVRSEILLKAGAEIFVGDLFNINDIRQSLVNIQRAYHCPPFAPNLLHGTMLFAIAAEEAKLEVVALMSGWNAHPNHPALLTREHWIANNIYRMMPTVDVIHINPGLFAWTYLFGLSPIVHFGMLVAPWGNGMNAPPANEDIGSVAACVLMVPSNHIGKCYRPTGPKLISPNDIAEILTKVIGRKVKYHDTNINMLIKAATAQGYKAFEISHLRYYVEELRGGAYAIGAPTDHVEEICGRAPEPFESIARRYIAQPDLIVPGLRAGSKLGAIALMIKMLLTRAPDLVKWEHERDHPLLQNSTLAQNNPEWVTAAEKNQLLLSVGL